MLALPYRAELHHNVPLNLEATLFCGQAFRWQKVADNAFQGVVYGEILRLTSRPNALLIESTASRINGKPLRDFAWIYLGLEDNLSELFSPSFISRYPHLYRGASKYFGLRLLRQEPFEALISFMCAQGIGIALIRRQVSLFSLLFGDFIAITEKSFPAPEVLAAARLSTLVKCANNNPIRAKNIRAVAHAVAKGELDLRQLSAPTCDFQTARETLLRYDGIGEKIADCVCLFGLGHREAFPIDTHVRQYLKEWFGIKTSTATLSSKTYRWLCDEARAILGKTNAGLAGQLLFHYWRKDIKGLTAF
ncbi:MAG: Fe-S cluster assembly protein HesB [Chloroherpetonaceae bacterium]|nr:Fe-S cluster assembly protein HesB [Chloroherpetonaceae bacterium]MDW8437554.1 DNA glycosylase [Chloroherpetonaceae bacterium]